MEPNTRKPEAEVVSEPETLTLEANLASDMWDEDQIDLRITESGGIEIIAAD